MFRPKYSSHGQGERLGEAAGEFDLHAHEWPGRKGTTTCIPLPPQSIAKLTRPRSDRVYRANVLPRQLPS